MNTLKPTKLYTSKGYIFWYVSYISKKAWGVYKRLQAGIIESNYTGLVLST